MIYITLFLEFFLIGLFTFGGGYAMIPLVEDTVINKYGWMTTETFSYFIGVCESTPGPIAINMATYVGSIKGGFFGSVVATLGVALPSIIIIILVASVLKNLTKNRHFQNALKGVKPVVLGLIFSTGLILVAKAIGFESITSFVFNYKSLIIMGIITIGYILYQKNLKKKPNTILIILFSACLGMLFSLF